MGKVLMGEVLMDADFSIELGREDPVLDFPWKDPAGQFTYRDLKRHPELLAGIDEVQKFPELGEFLRMMNSAQSLVETAKCDAWETMELSSEEEIYDASHKCASYVDIVFSEPDRQPDVPLNVRQSLPSHEQFARKLVELLRRAPETPSAAEVCVRRCYFTEDRGVREGFYCTLYVSGYGQDSAGARQNWGVGLKLMANAIGQLSVAAMRA
jgi:hypothetical protein